MMLLVGVALGAAAAAWSWQLAGAGAAIITCFLFAFDPNFLAHARLVKNDVSLSLVMLGLAWTAWSVGKSARWWNILVMALLCGAAVTVKFSGLLLGPMLALMLVVRAVVNEPWRVLGRVLRSRASRLAAAAVFCLFAAVVSYVAIWACYGFRFDPTPQPGAMLNMQREVRRYKQEALYTANNLTWPTDQQIDAAPVPRVARFALWAQEHRLLPQAWTFGLVYSYRSTQMRATFLLGQHGQLGWWYYFPLAMLFKTPIATLLAMLGSALLFSRAAVMRWSALCIAIPFACYALSALTTRLNLGLRHVLPLYPFIYVMIGVGASRLRARWPRAFTPVVSVLAIGLAVESLAAFPHYISFFNAPSRPYRLTLLSDSNIDWGQDLPYVAEWQQKHPGIFLYLGYMGSADPAFYGIRYTNIPGGFMINPRREWPPSRPGVIAISAMLLQGVNCPPICRTYYAPLRDREPRQILGDSIYLYDWPPR
jgi:hypothetical protein